MLFLSCYTHFFLSITDRRMDGYFLGTYSVGKSGLESVSTQQIPVKFYEINLILSLLAPLYANEVYSVNDF